MTKGEINMEFPMNCKGCGKVITNDIDLWDKKKELCDVCSMEQNSGSCKSCKSIKTKDNKINNRFSYIN